MTKDIPGASSRTPFKHGLLDAELGRIVGIVGTPAFHTVAMQVPGIERSVFIVDMCAGDAKATEFDRKTSPGIIKKHATFPMLAKNRVPVEVVLIDKAAANIDSLQAHANSFDAACLHQDAADYVVPSRHFHSCVFVHCDPNNVSQLPVTEAFMASLGPYATFLATLGCNAGGIKRASSDIRAEWGAAAKLFELRLPEYHDLLLVEVVKDKHQWAYLMRVPSAWSTETESKVHLKGAKDFEYGVNVSSFRRDRPSYDDAWDRLFLTRKERGLSR